MNEIWNFKIELMCLDIHLNDIQRERLNIEYIMKRFEMYSNEKIIMFIT